MFRMFCTEIDNTHDGKRVGSWECCYLTDGGNRFKIRVSSKNGSLYNLENFAHERDVMQPIEALSLIPLPIFVSLFSIHIFTPLALDSFLILFKLLSYSRNSERGWAGSESF